MSTPPPTAAAPTPAPQGPAGAPRAAGSAARRPARPRDVRRRTRHFHERAGFVDRERRDSDDFRQPRRLGQRRHVGHHRVRRLERRLHSADRLAHPAHRPDQAVRRRHPAVRDLVVAVRPRADAAGIAGRARVAGRGGRAADSALAGDSARLVSEGEIVDGALAVGDDRDRRPDCRSRARRLDHRQLFVVVDLLHQHSGRPVRGGGHVDHLPQARIGDAQGADRHDRARVARRVGGVACRSCSTRAATSTGSRRR